MSAPNSPPVYSYVVRTEARDVVMFQRTIYLEGDASDGFRLLAKIDEEDTAIDLSEILLEDAMSSDDPGDVSISENVVDGFGHVLGQAVARQIVALTPDLSSSKQAELALAGIVRSLGAPYTEALSEGTTQYRFDHCPLCDASDRTGIEEVDLAHRALSALVVTTIGAIHPDRVVSMPRGKNDEHVFGLA
ncbi:hypothetical protein VSU19_14665 [Verrucomicrobiales bacterium BCK34]|nr:hypothetical protein [Verrucomicrobiales bacterium BCK34]